MKSGVWACGAAVPRASVGVSPAQAATASRALARARDRVGILQRIGKPPHQGVYWDKPETERIGLTRQRPRTCLAHPRCKRTGAAVLMEALVRERAAPSNHPTRPGLRRSGARQTATPTNTENTQCTSASAAAPDSSLF